MALHMRIEMDGKKEMNHILAVSTKNVKDLRPAWKELSTLLDKFQKGIFLTKGKGKTVSYYGVTAKAGGLNSWKDLAESTKNAKRASRYSKWAEYPLIRTQKLMKAFSNPKAPGAIRIQEKLAFGWGIDDDEIPYGKYHHSGRGVPKRKVLRLPDNLKKIIDKLIQRHLVKTGQLNRGVFRGSAFGGRGY